MSDQTVKTDIPAFEPADAEIERRAIELAKADGVAWAAPGTPSKARKVSPARTTDEDQEKYRKLAQERLEAERGLRSTS